MSKYFTKHDGSVLGPYTTLQYAKDIAAIQLGRYLQCIEVTNETGTVAKVRRSVDQFGNQRVIITDLV